MTFHAARRRSDFTAPVVVTVETRSPHTCPSGPADPDAEYVPPLPSPPPPRPVTCPDCGSRPPSELVHDHADRRWTWACSSCAAEVRRVDAAPRQWEPSDEEWDDDADAPRTIRPVTRQQERAIVRLAKKRTPTATIAAKVKLAPSTVRKIRARHGLEFEPGKPKARIGRGLRRCQACRTWVPVETRGGRNVLVDVATRLPHNCKGT